LIGLILIGVVLIWQPAALDDLGRLAQATTAVLPEETETATPTATKTATPRPSPTLVPLGTQPAATPETTASGAEAEETQDVAEQTMTAVAVDTAAAQGGNGEEATPAPTESPEEDDELAQTGIGWGLILFSGAGLGLLAAVARRLRLTPQ
jgi:hypothetical protein